MKVAFYTLGCKVNQYETKLMEEEFLNNSYEIVDFKEKSDIYVINSCSVTNLSTRKSRQAIAKARKINSEAVIVLVGCYVEELSFTSSTFKLYDLALGNEDKKEIIRYINEFLSSKKISNTNNKDSNIIVKEDIGKVRRYVQSKKITKMDNIRQAIKIQDGCNYFCSYCIIPYTRGRSRSRSLEEILNEVNQLVNSGVKEVVLVGIEIASYGTDFKDKLNLIDVIEAIEKIDGIERIRLGSIEPRWMTDDIISKLKNITKLCHHFHLSIQSLNNNILKAMNRRYNKEFILDVISKLKSTFIDVAITTDIIVGFINETDEEFLETYNISKLIGFSHMHVFKFSKREHTKAYSLSNNVTGDVSNMRSEKLISLSNEMTNNYLDSMIGKKYEVLIEECKDGFCYGYTKNYVKVKVKGDNKLWGKIVEVEFLEIERDLIIANLI